MVISEVVFACLLHTLYNALLKICSIGVNVVFHNVTSQQSRSQNKMHEVDGLFLDIFEREKKIEFFNFWLRAYLAYKINPIKIDKE